MTNLIWNKENISIIASNQDIASITIAKQVEKLDLPVFYLENKSFLQISDEDLPEADNYIILSRHSSAASEPAFTVHSVGNFSPDKPKLGGKAATLGKTQAEIQTYLLYSLAKNLDPQFTHFDIVAEATHHGPLVQKPVIFIEMGSSDEVWNSERAAAVIAKSIEYFLTNYENFTRSLPVAIGFGGGHYPRKIVNTMLALEYAVGHICPKYAIDFLTPDIVSQMVRNTLASNKVEYALFDKKGMKKKQEIKELVTSLGLSVIEI